MNDKIKKEKEDKIIETSSEKVKVEESIVEVVEEKKDEKQSSSNDSKKNIKDYLNKDLFADVKRISFSDDQPLEDDKLSLIHISEPTRPY